MELSPNSFRTAKNLFWVAMVALLATGCSEQAFRALSPDFSIVWSEEQGYVEGVMGESAMTFGDVTTGEIATIPVVMSNPGSSDLALCETYLAAASFDENGELNSETRVESDPEVASSGPAEAMILGNGSVLDFEIRFVPLYGTPIDPNLYFVVKHELNWDCEANEGTGLYIPIVGFGDGDPRPDISSKPASVDFGTDWQVGDISEIHDIVLMNLGPGQLDIFDVTLSDETNFTLDVQAAVGAGLQTGIGEVISVTFNPTVDGPQAAEIVVESNDPDEASYVIPLNGSADGIPLGKGPVAVCAPDFISQPFSSEQFDGSGSYDPDGLSLTYLWALTPPTTSAEALSNATSATPGIYLDVAGDYVATLTVTNSAGQSSLESCTQTITSIPNENFRIELAWVTSGDDMDLHLLRPDTQWTAGGPRSDDDCYYGNCNTSGGWSTPPDWGVIATDTDDPGLDLDDISGVGPENINISAPANVPHDGWYQIFVHDYPGSSYTPANDVTLNIYLNGVIAQAYNFQISDEDNDYYVAEIHWPIVQVVACAGLGGCP
jgi:hypothetical protein